MKEQLPSSSFGHLWPIIKKLSPRRRELLTLVAQGFNNAEIARRMQVAGPTVETTMNALRMLLPCPAGFDQRSWLVVIGTRYFMPTITPSFAEIEAERPHMHVGATG